MQLDAAAHKAEAESATAAKHSQRGEEQVISLRSQPNSVSQVALAEARKLHQQLKEAQAEAASAADPTAHISGDC